MAHWPRDRVDLVALTAQGVRKSGAQSCAPDEVRIGTDGKSYPATRARRVIKAKPLPKDPFIREKFTREHTAA
jgi:hypothetical protein